MNLFEIASESVVASLGYSSSEACLRRVTGGRPAVQRPCSGGPRKGPGPAKTPVVAVSFRCEKPQSGLSSECFHATTAHQIPVPELQEMEILDSRPGFFPPAAVVTLPPLCAICPVPSASDDSVCEDSE